MANYTIRIVDQNGKSMKVSINILMIMMSWQTLDKGFIRYDGGENTYSHSNGTLTTQHLHFHHPDQHESGLRLNDWVDIIGVNDGGEGHISQSWVLGLTPGRVSWYLMS